MALAIKMIPATQTIDRQSVVPIKSSRRTAESLHCACMQAMKNCIWDRHTSAIINMNVWTSMDRHERRSARPCCKDAGELSCMDGI